MANTSDNLWIKNMRDEDKTAIFEREILTRIFGPAKKGNEG